MPDRGNNTKWFFNLNKFQQAETLRQVEFKEKYFGEFKHGRWSKDGNLFYPHILPSEKDKNNQIKKVFYSNMADEIIKYCNDNDIEIHQEALNLKSSQVCCFNLIFPLRLDFNLAKMLLSSIYKNIKSVSKVEFEYTGDLEITKSLGEPLSGKRGQNRTSIDAAIWWEDNSKKPEKYITLIEWKYTEANFGKCGGYSSKSNKHKEKCKLFNVSKSNPLSDCYLVYKHKRKYWELLEESGINLTMFNNIPGCPFQGLLYQLMRQYLVAHKMKFIEKVDKVFVVSISFKNNNCIHNVPNYLKRLKKSSDDTILDVWNNALSNAPKMLHYNIEALLTNKIKEILPKPYKKYIDLRYGL